MTKDIPYYCDNEDSNIIRLFVIRHGQTEHNVQKILQGHQDTDLNRTGIAQAAKLGDYLEKSNIKFDKVFSSDLKRCKQTIQKVLETSGQANISVEYCKGLRERCMGVIEGMHITDAEAYASKHGKGSFRDFGESPDDFLERLTSCLGKCIADSIAENSQVANLAVVSHGGAIRTLLRWLHYEEGNAHNIIVFNTSVTIIDYFRQTGEFVVRRVGNTQHLGDGEFVVSDLRLR
ncbi:hypothetical protein HG535_0B01960 [Zygotorulaspora mrakii]|uniref:Uncharacterized protein n=1 Tax=Zygotorulaspora mrakii TaxID=42260 RepID=A0A7H9AXL3_ZYGMR|nr:uncharacterized protein HG535_0B01960 [Zygotorulaspora mrakii]QLG71158.1 hypothetical protein HG535_0B01960 [Zygotorulaspora mrakii]